MNGRYREFRFYDGNNDRQAVRLSMFDAHHQEFWTIVPKERGKSWRKVREEALIMLDDAMARGDQPGQVLYGNG